jgi:hypothetical protein
MAVKIAEEQGKNCKFLFFFLRSLILVEKLILAMVLSVAY